MNPAIVYLRIAGALIVLVLVAFLLWWGNDLFQAKRERAEAQVANKSLVGQIKADKAKDEKIDGALVVREKRMDKSAAAVEGKLNDVANIEAAKPEVKSWGDVLVPADLVFVRPFQKPGSSGEKREAGVQHPAGSDSAGKTP